MFIRVFIHPFIYLLSNGFLALQGPHIPHSSPSHTIPGLRWRLHEHTAPK